MQDIVFYGVHDCNYDKKRNAVAFSRWGERDRIYLCKTKTLMGHYDDARIKNLCGLISHESLHGTIGIHESDKASHALDYVMCNIFRPYFGYKSRTKYYYYGL